VLIVRFIAAVCKSNSYKMFLLRSRIVILSASLLLILSLLSLADPADARPTNLREQEESNVVSLFKGAYVGWTTALSLMGYYEDDAVKDNLLHQRLDINAAPDQDDRTTVQIVGLGLGRTGTTSLVVALDLLGYTSVHDDEQVELTDLYAAWERDDIEIDEVHEILGLRGYNVTMKTADYPWVLRHPEVKAILTVRDSPDKYVNSWLAAASFMTLMEQAPWKWMATVQAILPSLEEEYKVETTSGNIGNYLDPRTLRENYVAYISTVQDAIPAEQLLTFNVKQGWAPLCEFLGTDVPDVPFPHVHTRAKLQGEMYFLTLLTWTWRLAVTAPLYVALLFAKKYIPSLSTK